MNATLDSTAPPASQDLSHSDDGARTIVVLWSTPGPNDYSVGPGNIFGLALQKTIADAGIISNEVFAAGDFERTLGWVDVKRSDVLPAVAAIRVMLDITRLSPRSAIFWEDRDERAFRTAHYGLELGPPLTLTREQLGAWLEECKQKLIADLRSRGAWPPKPPPTDAPPPAPGDNPT